MYTSYEDLDYEPDQDFLLYSTQQFIIHQPQHITSNSKHNKKNSKKCKIYNTQQQIQKHIRSIKDQCTKIQEQLQMKTQQQFCQRLIETINLFFSHSFKDSQDISDQNGFKLIIPVSISQTQQEDSKFFLKAFRNKIIDEFTEQEHSSSSNTFLCKSQLFNSCNHINLIDLSESSMRLERVLLESYINYKQKSMKEDIFIVLSPYLPNFDAEKLNLIHKSIQETNLIFIVPTRKLLTSYEHKQLDIRMIPLQFFDIKSLFKQFIVNCMFSKKMVPFLPSQSLTLLSQLDNFPISFREACRRFTYCLCSFNYEIRKKKIQIETLQFEQLCRKIRKAITKTFQIVKFAINRKNIEFQILVGLIDPNKQFRGIKNVVDTLSKLYQCSDLQVFDQYEYYQQIEQRIFNSLKQSEHFNKYLKEMQKVNDRKTSKKKQQKQQKPIILQLSTPKKNRRITHNTNNKSKAKSTISTNQKILLSSPTKSLKSNKTHRQIYVENKINDFLNVYSKNIQKLTKTISWKDIKYQNTIKPAIVKEVASSFAHNDKFQDIFAKILIQTKMTLHQIYTEIDCTLMSDDNSLDFGQIVFAIKQLILYGIINCKHQKLNSIVTCGYFDKAKYNHNRIKK